MENIYYEVVVGEMSSFFEENGFKEKEGVFLNDTKAFKIEYDHAKNLYNLLCANVTDGNIEEFAVISSYLFDQTQNKNDAVSVGIDFVDSARKSLGVKTVRRSGSASGSVDLPSANSSGNVTVTTLTAKLLANYPELKETYKAEIEEKGKYLYLDFCTTYFIPEIRKTLDSHNKKAIKKLIDMLCEVYVAGDRTATSLVVMLLSSAIGTDGDRFKAATDRMGDCPHLITTVNNQVSVLVKNKKLQKALKYNA